MWLRVIFAGWSLSLLVLLAWLTTQQSSESRILGRYSPEYFTLLVTIALLAAAGLLAQHPFLYRRLHLLRREIALVVFSMFLSLLVAELAIRVLDPLGVSYFAETAKYHLDKIPDDRLVFKHKPGLQRTYQGVEVSINELGLRDRPLEKKQAGEVRILLLGDSVTFGWGVPVEATFGRRLEQMLVSRLGRPVRTVNTGVAGYNTVQEYAALERYADVVEPDIVVLVYAVNDIESNDPPFDPRSALSLRGKSPPEAINILLWKSWLYRLGRFAYFYAPSNDPESLDPRARGVKDSLEALSAIATFCRTRGISFATFFYRSNREPTGGVRTLLGELKRVGRMHGFPVVDVGAWWGDVDMRVMTNSVIDPHPNEQGHAIVAREMAEVLLAQGLVPRVAEGSR
jgi:lysophospholipase L1-like esterase